MLSLSLEDAHRGTTVSLVVEHEDGSRTLAVTVPPGATDGQRLRLRGKGGAGARGGEVDPQLGAQVGHRVRHGQPTGLADDVADDADANLAPARAGHRA